MLVYTHVDVAWKETNGFSESMVLSVPVRRIPPLAGPELELPEEQPAASSMSGTAIGSARSRSFGVIYFLLADGSINSLFELQMRTQAARCPGVPPSPTGCSWGSMVLQRSSASGQRG